MEEKNNEVDLFEDESKDFDDGYDENLMGDEEDKKKLAQMTEKEREQELFYRSERRETLRIRFEIEKKLRFKRKLERKQNKQVRKRLRASEIYSSDESSEESDEYIPETEVAPKKEVLYSSSSSSDSASASSNNSSSEESEPENEKTADEDAPPQDKFQMTLADLKSIQLKRERIEKWVYSPFFKETAIGLFVKISVGNHPRTNEHMYKIGQIVDITEGKVYSISITGQHKTDKWCVVRIGGAPKRTHGMNFISNRSFDEDDFCRWKDQIHMDGQEAPGLIHFDYFNKKKRDLHRANNYQYKDEDIEYEVNQRSRFREIRECNFALKKTELIAKKADAEASNDYERSREIQLEIDELEERAKELEKTRSSSRFSAISFVNERNRIKNIVESERVLKESKSIKTEDPFTRRKCTPTIVHNKHNNNDVNNSSTNDNNSNNITNTIALEDKLAAKPEKVDDLFQAHASIDLELDIDI